MKFRWWCSAQRRADVIVRASLVESGWIEIAPDVWLLENAFRGET